MNGRLTSIIVLNYNGWEDTIECIESLLKHLSGNYNIVVVDNASINDSVTQIKNHIATSSKNVRECCKDFASS